MPYIPPHVEGRFRGTSGAGAYGDTLELIDYHVGRLVSHVEQLGLAEDTIFIVTSDSGPWFGGHRRAPRAQD
ncbi:hypothetical protein GCM10023169_40400 [Georgenia halophila]|uniref:Sulfatase N-terminal domain-containing protein n=1 Tax=Georgenia halophila TaxID=620889 RepID=A0ABP8LQM4_9MICO